MKKEANYSRTVLCPMWGEKQEWSCIQANRNARITRSLGQAKKPWVSAILFSVTFEDLLIELHLKAPSARRRTESKRSTW